MHWLRLAVQGSEKYGRRRGSSRSINRVVRAFSYLSEEDKPTSGLYLSVYALRMLNDEHQSSFIICK